MVFAAHPRMVQRRLTYALIVNNGALIRAAPMGLNSSTSISTASNYGTASESDATVHRWREVWF